MAVYTQLSAETLAELVAHYDVGELVSAKGIAEGVSNSNWLLETAWRAGGRRFILTMYERRIAVADLPFFLGLLDHLSAAGLPVPHTIHDSAGAAWREVQGKAVALIEFLPGISVDRPTPGQAGAVGAVLARLHMAARDFGRTRANDLGPDTSARVLADCGGAALAAIDPSLPTMADEAARVAGAWPGGLPQSVIHSDLFPDNVLILGDRVSGLIDFYFACQDAMAYDLAVTHAAWSFADEGRSYRAEIGAAMVAGYESVRPLEPAERAALPLLAEAACLRFVSSRAQDWIETPADALVTRKDPMDFVRRFEAYRAGGGEMFA
ncbi:homoserine kinase [Erythrobacter arachoides]|uniref:Homoserine kinase n=1 Tax=Aurantiacibacter arachoides TaxID=1850444 RepID=A0A844ZWG0_9SPHN|nr:homoserine kinase [Aurantiacibacter arachoides]MXO92433.1 homoserine kinase [Aurantiacibacter arachoides]GGD57189.1 homoserine kinase [Aurantiacibacter arachoides]